MSTSTRIRLGLGLFAILAISLCLWTIYQESSTRLTSDKIASAYVKLAIAYECSGSDISKWRQEKTRILKEYGLSSEKINRFIAKCNRNPLLWVTLWEGIADLLRQEQQRLTSRAPAP